jgi:hypothetical protein
MRHQAIMEKQSGNMKNVVVVNSDSYHCIDEYFYDSVLQYADVVRHAQHLNQQIKTYTSF